MDNINKIILLATLVLFIRISFGLDCTDEYIDIDEECYYQSDIDVLQQFIVNSQGGSLPPPPNMRPIDLGKQTWENGRLVYFCLSNYSVSECNITDYTLSGQIPTEIGNLVYLTFLELGVTQLNGEIPDEIENLVNLTELKLYYNIYLIW